MGSSAAVDFTAGTLAGAAQLVVGHPFDTIKVKLQSQPRPAPGQSPQFSGALDATKQTLKHEGVRGLFKGMAAPLATVALFNAVLFATRGQMEIVLKHEDGSELTIGDQAVAGLGAGVAVSFLACPTELMKCRLQAQASVEGKAEVLARGFGTSMPFSKVLPKQPGKTAPVRYKGPMDVIRHVRTEKGIAGLYRGMAPTLTREMAGNATMFAIYEMLKQKAAAMQGLQSTKELGVGSLMVAGGLGGVAYWGPVYPADVIKSRMQVDDLKNPQFRGMMDCFRKTLAHDGVAGLYKGFGPAIARSFPANGACFLVYELVSSALQSVAKEPAPEVLATDAGR